MFLNRFSVQKAAEFVLFVDCLPAAVANHHAGEPFDRNILWHCGTIVTLLSRFYTTVAPF